MRITRVVLSFFSVGFLAGSFEQAAGLGSAGLGEPAPAYTAALVSLPSAFDPALPSLDGLSRLDLEVKPGSGPESGSDAKSEPKPETESDPAPTPEGHTATAPVAAGDARGGDKAKPANVALATAAKSAPEAAPTPKLRPFFAPEEGPLVVPEPQIAKRPQEFIMPIEKGRVTSMFNQGRYHPAIDLAAPLGSPVYATTRKQRVVHAGWRGGYGNLVITADPQGRQHYYGHLKRIVTRVGAILDQGETLGLLGSTGHSTGPHVHYEVRTRNGQNVDPARLLFAGMHVRRGYAWNTPRPVLAGGARIADRSGQPRPR